MKQKYDEFTSPQHYDEIALKNPNRWIDPTDEVMDNIIRTIIVRFFPRNRSNLKVIDLGCGGGRTIRMLQGLDLDIIGVDFSEETLKIARRLNPDVKFLNMDITETTFDSKSFDIVLSVGTHEHLPEITFAEARRLIKNVGLFICVLPTASKSTGWSAKEGGLWQWDLTRDDWSSKLWDDNFLIDRIMIHKWIFVCYPIILKLPLEENGIQEHIPQE